MDGMRSKSFTGHSWKATGRVLSRHLSMLSCKYWIRKFGFCDLMWRLSMPRGPDWSGAKRPGHGIAQRAAHADRDKAGRRLGYRSHAQHGFTCDEMRHLTKRCSQPL